MRCARRCHAEAQPTARKLERVRGQIAIGLRFKWGRINRSLWAYTLGLSKASATGGSAQGRSCLNPPTHPSGRRLPERPKLPEPGSSPTAAHCGQPMVDPQVHQHVAALCGATLNPRGRRLTKCAKNSGHYPVRIKNPALNQLLRILPNAYLW